MSPPFVKNKGSLKANKDASSDVKHPEILIENDIMTKVTFNGQSTNHFFQGATHKSNKEFSLSKSGFQETFSFGMI